MGYGPCLSNYSPGENQNLNPKNSPGEKSENAFKSTTSPSDKIPFYKKKKLKKLKALDKYVIFSITIMLIYTIIDKITFIMTGGMESSTLTTAFFGVFGGEIFLCAMLKRLKLKKGDE